MPIAGVDQPEVLPITHCLQLRKFDGHCGIALAWYQDPETLKMVDGKEEPYNLERLERMYTYLERHGELYWIEIKEGEAFAPVGDVTFWQEDMPIVIGDRRCRGRGIGRRVVQALIARAGSLHYDHLCVEEIYHYNIPSRRMFEACGFRETEKTERGSSYRLELEQKEELWKRI